MSGRLLAPTEFIHIAWPWQSCTDTLNSTLFSSELAHSVLQSPVQERCDKRRVPLSYPTPLLLYTITLPTASLVRTPYPLLKSRQEYSYRLLNRAQENYYCTCHMGVDVDFSRVQLTHSPDHIKPAILNRVNAASSVDCILFAKLTNESVRGALHYLCCCLAKTTISTNLKESSFTF